MLLASKGETVADVTVGDCVEPDRHRGAGPYPRWTEEVDFYLRLRTVGVFLEDARHSIRAFGVANGRLTIDD